MADQNPILSVCIPTFNRAKMLEEALNAVIVQIVDNSLELMVEINISDNASSDNTQEIVNAVQNIHPQLKIYTHKQRENIGPDGNIYSSLKMAHGTWAWILSDDDIIIPGTLIKLINLLKESAENTVICVNARSFNQSPLEITPLFLQNNDGVIDSPDGVMLHLNSMITFLSIMVIPVCSYISNDYSAYVGTFLLQSYIFIDAISATGGMRTISEPFLAVRANNSGGYDFYKIFGTEYANILKYAALHGYSQQIVQNVMRIHLRKFIFPFTCSFKVRGSLGKLKPDFGDGRRRLMELYRNDPFFWLVMLPLLLTPSSLLMPIAALKRKLSKSGSRT